MFKTIPTYIYDSDTWETTEFETRESFIDFLWSIFKEPGKYEFDECSLKFNEQARLFDERGYYCNAPFRSKDFIAYWDAEKEKNVCGVIYKHKHNTWYITRAYYMYLNFLKLFNKEKGKFSFPDVRDVQYHMGLYETLAEYSYKNCAILKKRQCSATYFHMAVIINRYWFDEGSVSKMAASLKDYINEKGAWRYLEEYRNFLNKNTAWIRPSTPDKVLNWEQKIEVKKNGVPVDVGLKSAIMGLVLDKDPTNGTGGYCTIFYHEEAGIAPKMNTTLEYLLPALSSGMISTGMFIASGSVGDLDQCEPLKELMFRPHSKNVLAVPTNLVDGKGKIGECGLFIPEQWGMPPCIDKYGNSDVEGALKMLEEDFEKQKRDKTPEDYQLYVSQHPRNIEEAFAYRNVSIFPQHLIAKQIQRIDDGDYFREFVELERENNGKIKIKPSNRLPINQFPIDKKAPDKEGVVVIYERPIEDPPFGTYYASVDPISAGKTVTTDSLFSVYIYKNDLEVIKHKKNGTVEHIIEPGKIVAAWCGRFDDLNKTHMRAEMMIELYNAWTVVENNVSQFIIHMIDKNKQKYLVPKNQLLFLKEIGTNTNVFQEYGWRNVGRIFKDNLLPYGIQFLEEELDVETKADGEIVKIIRGIERIPDKMLLEEMKAYHDDLNCDRLISFCALAAFIKVQKSNRGLMNKVEREEGSFDNSNKNVNFKMTPFRHLGRDIPLRDDNYRNIRKPFKTLK